MKKLVLLLLSFSSATAFAAYGLGLGQEPKYPADFRAYEYVNPDAPKGGVFSLPMQAALIRSTRLPSKATKKPASSI